MTQLRYDTSFDIDTPCYRCPECKSQFFGGGRALHNEGCTKAGYSKCEILITPMFVEAIKQYAARFGDDAQSYGVSLNMLQEQLPESLS
jgi:hypothetical protein